MLKMPPVGSDGQHQGGRATPPAPESPLWLPALAQAAGGAGRLTDAAAAGALPRAKDLRAAAASQISDPRQLFDAKTLTQQQLPLQPGRVAPSGWHSGAAPALARAVHPPPPRLPAIEPRRTDTTVARERTEALTQLRAGGGGSIGGTSAEMAAAPGTSFEGEAARHHMQDPRQQHAGTDATTHASSAKSAARRGSGRAGSPAADADHVTGVDTGAGAVAFFGRHGQEGPVKFFYCSR
jgi:hypothetical protein